MPGGPNPCSSRARSVTNILTAYLRSNMVLRNASPRTTSESSPPTATPNGSNLTNEETEASDWGDLCIEGCLHSGYHRGKEMIRCCNCASWVHTHCIAQKEEFVAGVWPCFKCRQMPSQVRDLTSSVDVLTGLVKSLVSSLDDLKLQQQQLERSLSEKEETCQKLSVENAQLRQRVADVAASSSDERWGQFPRTHGTAILGSSIVRDIDQNKLVATKCICMPGGHIKDIHTKLDQFPPDN